MRALFGQSWTRQYGEVDGGSFFRWQEWLGNLTGAELQHGMNACVKWEDPFAPTFQKFRKLCSIPEPSWTAQRIEREKEEAERHRREGGNPYAKALEHVAGKARLSPVAVAELEKMKKLKGSGTDRDEDFYAAARHLGVKVN